MVQATKEDIVRLAMIVRELYCDVDDENCTGANSSILSDVDKLIYDLTPEPE